MLLNDKMSKLSVGLSVLCTIINVMFSVSAQGWIQDERVLEEATQKVALLYQNYR